MAADQLTLRICGADRQPLSDRFDLDISTWPERVRVVTERDQAGTISITGLVPTKTYQIVVWPLRHRPVSAFALPGRTVDLFCPVQPSLVSDVVWPAVYPDALTRIMPVEEITALDAIARAGLLNVYAKLDRAALWPYVTTIREVRGDRLFATVTADVGGLLARSPRFESVSGALHDPPDGFTLAGSFKERDVTAGVLQVTLFSRENDWQADIDIDDAGGLGHVFQVLDHALTGGATHPYDIQQILLFGQGLNPGYQLVTT